MADSSEKREFTIGEETVTLESIDNGLGAHVIVASETSGAYRAIRHLMQQRKYANSGISELMPHEGAYRSMLSGATVPVGVEGFVPIDFDKLVAMCEELSDPVRYKAIKGDILLARASRVETTEAKMMQQAISDTHPHLLAVLRWALKNDMPIEVGHVDSLRDAIAAAHIDAGQSR